MGYANKNWVQTQFENFSKRIAAVFARKSDMPTSLPASNTTSDYSATGTDPVNGVAVSKALQTQQEAIDGAYQHATGYTDQAIANLINGAPSTLDTLGEIAAAMEENADVVDALEAAIGTKASQDELDGHTGNNTIHITASERQAWNGKQTMTGDTKDNTVTFTSGDNANPAGWENVGLITSGEKQSSLWNKMSLFAKNVRYLWKLLGNTSLSGIGDGTVTGAINTLNTSLVPISLPVTIYGSEYINGDPSVIVNYVSGMAFLVIHMPIKKEIPAWTGFPIAKVTARFNTTYSPAVTPANHASALVVTVSDDGGISVSTHDAVSTTGWYYTSFPARCFL